MGLRQTFGTLLFAASLFGQTATQPLQVTAIRFWSLADVTRVAIETNGEFRYKSDRIQDPDRIFFDLIDARPHLDGKRVTVKTVGDKLLKRVRVAETVPGVTRVVLDLEPDVDYTASQLGNPDRLMIELRPATLPHAPSPTAVTVSSAATPDKLSAQADLPIRTTAMKPDLVAGLVSGRTAAPVEMPPPPTLPAQPKAAEPRAARIVPDNQPAANAARRISTNSQSLTRALGLKINRVVIDPGHGGHDQGTTGEKGLLEKDLVLDVALRLGKLIEQRMGSEVIYTRSDDTFVPLEERTAIANQKRADLFLSIHANSSAATKVAGIETYYLNFTASADALDVAARENASSQKSVYELQDLVQSIAKHDKIEESREFAGDIQSALQNFEIHYSPSAKDRGIRKAPFVVLIGAQMPSVLAEIGFLSNPREESLLSRPDHRQKLAEALYKGLAKYVQTLSHFEITKSSAKPEDGLKTVEFTK